MRKSTIMKSFRGILLACCMPFAANAMDLSSVPEGRWVELPGTSLRSVAPQPAPGGNVAKITAWSGASYDSKRRRVVVWGGGHSDYGGNEVYAFDLNTQKWLRLTDSSQPDAERTALYPDGEPRARHTYDYVEYVPPLDRVISFGGSGPYPRGGGEFTRDLAEFSPDARRWTVGERAAVPTGGSIIGAHARYDPVTESVFFVGSQNATLKRYVVRGDLWQQAGQRSYVRVHSTAALAPDRRQMIVIGTGKDGSRQAKLWQLDQPDDPVVDLTAMTQGATQIESAYGPGFDYHSPSRTYVAWAGGGDVYILNPDSWTWRRLPAPEGSPSPGQQNSTGTYGRFRYVADLDIFVLVNGVDQNVFVYRLQRDVEPRQAAVQLEADVSSVAPGEMAQLSWHAEGMTDCMAMGAWQGAKPASGMQRVGPIIEGTTYELSCSDGSGGYRSSEVTVAVHPTAPSVVIRANPAVVAPGEMTRIEWSAADARGCTASGAWHGPRMTSGWQDTQRIHRAERFQIECYGPGGMTVRSTAVSTAKASWLAADDSSGSAGGTRGGLGSLDFATLAGLTTVLAVMMARRA